VAAAAEAAPQRRIGVRTREALDVLLASRQCSQVRLIITALASSLNIPVQCIGTMHHQSTHGEMLTLIQLHHLII
jgi:hypothetical protein